MILINKTKYKTRSFWFQLQSQGEEKSLLALDSEGRRLDKGALFCIMQQDASWNSTVEYLRSQKWGDAIWSNSKEEGVFSLKQYPQLLRHIEQRNRLLNEQGELISYQGKGRLHVDIVGQEQLSSTLSIIHDNCRYPITDHLSDECVLSGEKWFRLTAPFVFPSPYSLSFFQSTFSKKELPTFLSLLFSYCASPSFCYEEYRIQWKEDVVSQPALVFDKIDREKTLHIRVVDYLSPFPFEFLSQPKLSRIAIVSEKEKSIAIHNLVKRDLSEEIALVENGLKKSQKSKKQEGNYFFNGSLFLIDCQLAPLFLKETLPQLSSRFTLFGGEKLKQYRYTLAKPKLHLGLQGMGFLEGEAYLECDGEKVNLAQAMKEYQKRSSISLQNQVQWIIDAKYIEKLQRLLVLKREKVEISPFDLPFLHDFMEEEEKTEISQHSFYRFLTGLHAVDASVQTQPRTAHPLRPYQIRGFKWLTYLHRHRFGACLADDMGLGKTLQTLAFLSSIYPKEKKTSLIVVPKSLLFNWEKEIATFTPQLRFQLYYGSSRRTSLFKEKQVDLIITTYGTVRNEIDLFSQSNFHCIILDESQQIKNLSSRIFQAVIQLKGDFRIALSGTPFENNMSELYALFRFLHPSLFGSYREFQKRYLLPIQKEKQSDILQELQTKIRPYILRRIKKEVIKDLPPTQEQTLLVPLTEQQQQLYEEKRQFYKEQIKESIQMHGVTKSQFFILQSLSHLRKIASIPEQETQHAISSLKRSLLKEKIKEIVEKGEKVLLFSNFLLSLELIQNDLNGESISSLMMTGQTQERKELIELFQTSEKYSVLLMTLKTGGVGLNLTVANHIFLFDPWWNVYAEEQAIGRCHRLGQCEKVFSYRLIAKGTIEEKIAQLQKEKRDLLDQLMPGEKNSHFSLDDIALLLGE